MSVRPPRLLARQTQPSPLAAIEHEVFTEQAGTLIRVTRIFEERLARLTAVGGDKAGGGEAGSETERQRLVDETAQALWNLTVQREVMGLTSGEALTRTYDIPAAVRIKAGIVTETPAMAARRRR